MISYKAEIFRKSLHLLALVVPIGMYILGKKLALVLLIPTILLALTIEWARVRSETVARCVHLVFGFMMREDEIPPIGGRVKINGATWILISAAVLLLLFPVHIAVVSLVVFMASDAAAALIGRPFGKHKWGNSAKSIEGSGAFFGTALFLLLLLGSWMPELSSTRGEIAHAWVEEWPVYAFIAACAAIVEALPIPINDNLRVPVVIGILLLARSLWSL